MRTILVLAVLCVTITFASVPEQCRSKDIAALLERAKTRLSETTAKLTALHALYNNYKNMTINPETEQLSNLRFLLAQMEAIKQEVKGMYDRKDLTETEYRDVLLLIKNIEEEVMGLINQYSAPPLNLNQLREAMKELNQVMNNLKLLIKTLTNLYETTNTCPPIKPVTCELVADAKDPSIACLNRQMALESKLKEAKNKKKQAKDLLSYLQKQKAKKLYEIARQRQLIAGLEGKVEMLRAQVNECANKPDPTIELNKELAVLRRLLALVEQRRKVGKISNESAASISQKIELLINMLLKDIEEASMKRFLACDLLKKQLSEAEKELNNAKLRLDQLLKELQALKDQITAQQITIQSLSRQVEELEKQLNALKECCKKILK